MRFFDGDVKHLDVFKFNSGERVKHFIRDDDEDISPLIRQRLQRQTQPNDNDEDQWLASGRPRKQNTRPQKEEYHDEWDD